MSVRVAVTGATGFVGRSVLPLLAGRGCTVETLGRDVAGLAPSAVVEHVAAFAPDVVVHLATHFLANHTADDIPALVRANVEWGTVVAEAAAVTGARLVTVESAWQHVDGAAYQPVSLYAATKQAFADVCRYYAEVRTLDVRSVTLFDTYGPGDVRPKLVPTLLRAARDGGSLSMSDGQQLIDLTYVEDVARGIVELALVADAPADGAEPSWVLRSWTPLTVQGLVARVEAVVGRPIDVAWGAREPRPREMRTDWVFGRSPVGWTPTVGLDEGLLRVWESIQGEGTG